MGGSPCQGFACQGLHLNFDDPRSKLFFTMVEIIEHFKPKYYLLENVGMRKQWQDIITQYMKVEPVHSLFISCFRTDPKKDLLGELGF